MKFVFFNEQMSLFLMIFGIWKKCWVFQKNTTFFARSCKTELFIVGFLVYMKMSWQLPPKSTKWSKTSRRTFKSHIEETAPDVDHHISKWSRPKRVSSTGLLNHSAACICLLIGSPKRRYFLTGLGLCWRICDRFFSQKNTHNADFWSPKHSDLLAGLGICSTRVRWPPPLRVSPPDVLVGQRSTSHGALSVTFRNNKTSTIFRSNKSSAIFHNNKSNAIFHNKSSTIFRNHSAAMNQV